MSNTIVYDTFSQVPSNEAPPPIDQHIALFIGLGDGVGPSWRDLVARAKLQDAIRKYDVVIRVDGFDHQFTFAEFFARLGIKTE